MVKTFRGISALALAAGFAASVAAAAEDPIGKAEFEHTCATCHGVSGKGTGPLADILSVKVPDLTQIAKANDGVFPTLKVIHTVDGRSGVRGHGGTMPIWGDRYKAQLTDEMGDYGAEIEVRGRILSLVYYLESIQE